MEVLMFVMTLLLNLILWICLDINECEHKELNDCTHECINTNGSYTCKCPKNYKGDGRRGEDGHGCTRDSKAIPIIIGMFLCSLILIKSFCML